MTDPRWRYAALAALLALAAPSPTSEAAERASTPDVDRGPTVEAVAKVGHRLANEGTWSRFLTSDGRVYRDAELPGFRVGERLPFVAGPDTRFCLHRRYRHRRRGRARRR